MSLGVAPDYLPLNARTLIWHTDKSRFSLRVISLTRHELKRVNSFVFLISFSKFNKRVFDTNCVGRAADDYAVCH